MKQENIKFYMNNPCVIIREVSEEFSEIKLTPHYADDFDGSQWCAECLVGNNGTPTPHTCGDAQEVIDIINDSQASIVVMAENRLIHDAPVEMASIKMLQGSIDKSKAMNTTLNDKNISLSSENNGLDIRIKASIATLDEYAKKSTSAELTLKNLEDKVELERQHLTSLKSQSSGIVNIGYKELRALVYRDISLRSLEEAGVDNWGAGDDCMDSDEIEKETDDVMGSYTK